MFLRLLLANSLFSLRDINLTLGLLPPRRHVVWRDSVGVESSRSGLKSECADIFHQSFLWLLRHTDEPQRGRNSCLWLQSRSVLSSFGVVLMSCRVNFHVILSALQYSSYNTTPVSPPLSVTIRDRPLEKFRGGDLRDAR